MKTGSQREAAAAAAAAGLLHTQLRKGSPQVLLLLAKRVAEEGTSRQQVGCHLMLHATDTAGLLQALRH
jgi:hypothetical protein